MALRLSLPAEWTDDPDRCRAVGVPEERLAYQSKLALALQELDRFVAAGVTWVCVLADAGSGTSASFRQALTARGLTSAVGIPRIQKAYPIDVTTVALVLLGVAVLASGLPAWRAASVDPLVALRQD